MRITIVPVMLALAVVQAAAAAEPPRPTWTHTRPVTVSAAALLAHAAERSSIIRGLLEDLERTDVVVYLTDSMAGLESEPRAYLRFVARAAGIRYLEVRIERWQAWPHERIACLGHELRHALEIAAAPDVVDAGGLSSLYRRIGWECDTGRFETHAARATGHRVRHQLTARGR